MHVAALVKLIHLMGPYNNSEKPISTKRLALLWDNSKLDSEPAEATLRQIQRYVVELSHQIDDLPPLLDYVEEDQTITVPSKKKSVGGKVERKPRRQRLYFLHHDSLMKWFMSEQAALNLVMTGQVVGQALSEVSEIGVKSVAKLAADVIRGRRSTRASRIANSVRFLPDGIGRLPAKLEPDLLQVIFDGIVRDCAVSFDYKKPNEKKAARRLVNPLGLVSKEGTMYLVASKGFDPIVQHYALQRATNASLEGKHVRYVPDGFDLDKHIDSTHRFSHQTGPDMELVLEVNEEAIFHFKERPLTVAQKIRKIGTDLYRVSAVVPDSYYLRPFLLSLKANVTVVEPIEMRKSLADEIKLMALNYLAN